MVNITAKDVRAAMIAAGLNPNNGMDVARFRDMVQFHMNQLPMAKQARLTQADVRSVLEQAADQFHSQAGMEKLKQQGRDKDTSALWELSGDTSKRAKRHEEARRLAEQEEPDYEEILRYAERAAQNEEGTRGATYIDLDALFRQARKEGKV